MEKEKTHYKVIQRETFAEFKDRGSKFMAFAFPINDVDEFKNKLSQLKKEHPKAVHYCYAYRLGSDGNTFRANDDGEPSGSAGKPILGQLDSKELINTAVVVVRYFGGTLLGVPGLINAYKTASSLALQLSPVTRKAIVTQCKIEFDYTRVNDVLLALKKWHANIIKQDMQLFCTIIAEIPIDKMQETTDYFHEMNGVEFRIL